MLGFGIYIEIASNSLWNRRTGCFYEHSHHARMGSSLNWGPFYKGAVLYWGPKREPSFRELPT